MVISFNCNIVLFIFHAYVNLDNNTQIYCSGKIFSMGTKGRSHVILTGCNINTASPHPD